MKKQYPHEHKKTFTFFFEVLFLQHLNRLHQLLQEKKKTCEALTAGPDTAIIQSSDADRVPQRGRGISGGGRPDGTGEAAVTEIALPPLREAV